MEVVINKCFGGFGLSEKALAKLKTDDEDALSRSSPELVRCVKELGDEVNTNYSELKVVTIPDGTDYVIHDYDGVESIHERHQVWH